MSTKTKFFSLLARRVVMSIFLNRIALFIVFFALISNCTKEVIRVYNPITDKDKKSHGVVAFGLYAYNQNHKNLLNLFSKDSGSVFAELGMYGVKFSEIVSKDAKKKVPEYNSVSD